MASQKSSPIAEKSEIEVLLEEERKKLGRKLTYDEALRVWNQYLEPDFEASRRAEQLSAKDFQITCF